MTACKNQQPARTDEAFAAFYTDEVGEECFYFKLLPRDAVRQVARTLLSMRLVDKFKIDYQQEEWRNGVACHKHRLYLLQRDEALMPIEDVERIVSEVCLAIGITLHWMPVNRLLNLKLKNY